MFAERQTVRELENAVTAVKASLRALDTSGTKIDRQVARNKERFLTQILGAHHAKQEGQQQGALGDGQHHRRPLTSRRSPGRVGTIAAARPEWRPASASAATGRVVGTAARGGGATTGDRRRGGGRRRSTVILLDERNRGEGSCSESEGSRGSSSSRSEGSSRFSGFSDTSEREYAMLESLGLRRRGGQRDARAKEEEEEEEKRSTGHKRRTALTAAACADPGTAFSSLLVAAEHRRASGNKQREDDIAAIGVGGESTLRSARKAAARPASAVSTPRVQLVVSNRPFSASKTLHCCAPQTPQKARQRSAMRRQSQEERRGPPASTPRAEQGHLKAAAAAKKEMAAKLRPASAFKRPQRSNPLQLSATARSSLATSRVATSAASACPGLL